MELWNQIFQKRNYKNLRRPGEGRGNSVEASGAGAVAVASLGGGLCPPVDVYRLT
jgi:hypothetical protein